MVFKVMISEKEQRQLFLKLIEQHKGILFKVARTYCQDDEDRQDLIQEIMIQLWQSFHKYNDKFKITTWFYRISLNVAISFYRKNEVREKNIVPFNEGISQMHESDISENEQQLRLLDQFINELKDLDKALILLYLEDKSHSEISDIMGISLSNVATKVSRIKEKLKLRFSQHKQY